MISIRRGDIVLVNLNPVRGSEQGKIRPALVIQNNISNNYSPTTIIAPITSKVYEKDYPTNVFLSTNESGLRIDSTILLNQIRTIDKARIIKKISSINGIIMREVDEAIKVSLGIN